jgi:hypothetical protein
MTYNQHNIIERKIKLLPQTHSPEVDYSLFIMVAVLVMLERLEKRSGTDLGAFPSSVFAGSASVSWFHVTLPPPQGNALGGLYIGLFRSRRLIWDEDGRHQSFEGQTS